MFCVEFNGCFNLKCLHKIYFFLSCFSFHLVIIQFSVQKSTEPIQPQTLIKFPKIYKPKPSVTSPEVMNYSENAVTSEKVLAKPDSCDQGVEEDKEVTALTRQGKAFSKYMWISSFLGASFYTIALTIKHFKWWWKKMSFIWHYVI